MHNFINNNRELCILTEFGLTEFFNPESGLPQGGVECPLHFICLNVILSFLNTHHTGYTMEYTARNNLRLPPIINKIDLSHVAFVDDITLIAGSHLEATNIIETVSLFIEIFGIEIASNKTKIQALNHDEENLIHVDNHLVVTTDKDIVDRILGLYINIHGNQTTQIEVIEAYVDKILANISKASITDQQCLYIINRCLNMGLLYKFKLLILSSKFIESIYIKMRTIFKQKCNLPRNFPSDSLYHKHLYSLNNL